MDQIKPSAVVTCEANFLPAADDGLAGQRQVEEGLPELEGQRVLQRLAVDDQRQFVLLLQRVAQGRAVVRQLGPSSLQGGEKAREEVNVSLLYINPDSFCPNPQTRQ